jgi:hypothetical protein
MTTTCACCGSQVPDLLPRFKDEVSREVLPSGRTLVVLHDEDPPDPREWDNLGTMVTFHRRYQIGDKHNFSQDELMELVNRDDVVSLPIYLMDHSGLSLRTGSFGDPWDSGQIGYIFVTYEKLMREFSVTEVTDEIVEKALANLESEVKVMDQYLRGDVYGYKLFSAEGDKEDSCWGFYGDDPKENGMYDNIG